MIIPFITSSIIILKIVFNDYEFKGMMCQKCRQLFVLGQLAPHDDAKCELRV